MSRLRPGDVIHQDGKAVGISIGGEAVSGINYIDWDPVTGRTTPKKNLLLESLKQEIKDPNLSPTRQLAYAILLEDEDAVWPLIDEIMATRTPPTNLPGLPTYHELLEALRMRAKLLIEPMMSTGHSSRVCDNNEVIFDLVKRCEGVKT